MASTSNGDALLDKALQEGALDTEIFTSSARRIQQVSESFEAETEAALKYAVQSGVRDRYLRSLLNVKAALDVDPPDWLVRDLIPRQSILMLYSREGVGKSFFTLALLASVASGTPFLGRAVKQGLALYVTCEGVRHIGHRLEAWLTQTNIEAHLEKFPFYAFGEPIPINTEEGLAHLRVILGALGFQRPAVVAFDTLASCSPSMDENSSQDVGRLLATCDWLLRSGASVILVHHSRKKGDAARGHTSLPGAVHTILRLDRLNTDLIRVSCEKQKDGQPFKPFEAQLKVVPLTDRDPDEDGHVKTSCVVTLKEPPPSENFILKALQAAGADGLTTTEIERATSPSMSSSTFYRHWREFPEKHPLHFDPATKRYALKPDPLPETLE